jgi:hypothetical protein
MERYMVDLLSNIDDDIKGTDDWSEYDSHYWYNTGEKRTPDDIMRSAGNSSFWKSRAAGICTGMTAKHRNSISTSHHQGGLER